MKMDKYFLDKYFAEFENDSLKIDQYMIDKLGIKHVNTFITIEDLYIYCIPVELALTKCRIILVLNDKEITVFQNKETKIRIHLKFENDFIPNRKASFYLWINYTSAKKLKSPANAWLVDFTISSISGIYQEVIINLFINNKKITDFNNSQKENQLFFDRAAMKQLSLQEIASIDNEKCLIIKISITKIFLAVNSLSNPFQTNSGDPKTIKMFSKKYSFTLSGTFQKFHELNRIPGLSIAELDISWSPYLAELLSSHQEAE